MLKKTLGSVYNLKYVKTLKDAYVTLQTSTYICFYKKTILLPKFLSSPFIKIVIVSVYPLP